VWGVCARSTTSTHLGREVLLGIELAQNVEEDRRGVERASCDSARANAPIESNQYHQSNRIEGARHDDDVLGDVACSILLISLLIASHQQQSISINPSISSEGTLDTNLVEDLEREGLDVRVAIAALNQ